MTVKEVEQLTGMTRANIRYYEMEGLMVPKRNANGHREYLESDVDELNKIKLLRMLYISIEEIKKLKAEEKELTEVLELQLVKLKMEKESVAQAMDICRMMHSDNVDFKSLNAAYYFEELNKMVQGERDVLKEDQVPAVIIPIRRYLARGLDYSIYGIIWNAFIMLICRKDLASAGILGTLANIIVIFVIMIVCEGLLLSCFGTTFGKWILGIRVTNIEDGKLSFVEACERCAYVIFFGLGLGIPVYQLYRQWKSYKTCKSGEPLKWEENSCLVLKDRKIWRNIVFALIWLVSGLVEVFLPYYAELPPNRGEITVSEFCENYNQMLEYKNFYGGGMLLDEEGKWKERDSKYQVMFQIPIEEYPEITYYVEDGKMTGLNFKGSFPSIYYNEFRLLIKAFVYGTEPKSVVLGEVEHACNEIIDSYANIEEKQYQIGNVEINYKDNLGEFELEMKVLE